MGPTVRLECGYLPVLQHGLLCGLRHHTVTRGIPGRPILPHKVSNRPISICVISHQFRFKSYLDISICIITHQFRFKSYLDISLCVISHQFRFKSYLDISICVISHQFRFKSYLDISICIITHQFRSRQLFRHKYLHHYTSV